MKYRIVKLTVSGYEVQRQMPHGPWATIEDSWAWTRLGSKWNLRRAIRGTIPKPPKNVLVVEEREVSEL